MNDLPTVFTQIEGFIRDFHNGDQVLTHKATTLQLAMTPRSFIGVEDFEIRTYADMIGWAIGAYQYYKDNPDLKSPNQIGRQQECAYHLLDLIERGRAHRIIKNVKITNKIQKLELENSQLKEQLANLKKLNSQLAKQNENFHKYFPDAGKGNGEVGDVE